MDEMFREAERLRILAWTFTQTEVPSAKRDKALDLYLKLSEWKEAFPAPE